MRTAQVIMFGSRGDHEPLIALSMALLETGKFDHVHICAQEDYVHLIPKDSKITVHALAFNMSEFWPAWYFEIFKAVASSILKGKRDPLQIQVRCLNAIGSRFSASTCMDAFEVAQKVQPNLVIGSMFLGLALETISRSHGIPAWFVNLQPNIPTSDYPFYMASLKNVLTATKQIAKMHASDGSHEQRLEYLDSYEELGKKLPEALENASDLFKKAGIAALTPEEVRAAGAGKTEGINVLNAYPRQLVPRSSQWPSSVYQVPPLADDYIPVGWKAEEKCPKLCDYFTRMNEKPFCVTFGSMDVQKKGSLTRAVFKALRSVGLKNVLILKGSADLGIHRLSWRDSELKRWAEEHVFVADEAPQNAWLMPKCSGILCHGGAGTAFVALRAGLPIVISPHLADQFFWGDLCTQLGIGAVAGPCAQKATAKSFEEAINIALSDEVRQRAMEIGESMRKEGSGRKLAADIIARAL